MIYVATIESMIILVFQWWNDESSRINSWMLIEKNKMILNNNLIDNDLIDNFIEIACFTTNKKWLFVKYLLSCKDWIHFLKSFIFCDSRNERSRFTFSKIPKTLFFFHISNILNNLILLNRCRRLMQAKK